jgi:hypothetical protein
MSFIHDCRKVHFFEFRFMKFGIFHPRSCPERIRMGKCIICGNCALDPTGLCKCSNYPRRLRCGCIVHVGCFIVNSLRTRIMSCPKCVARVQPKVVENPHALSNTPGLTVSKDEPNSKRIRVSTPLSALRQVPVLKSMQDESMKYSGSCVPK